jgi:hypothetical protein
MTYDILWESYGPRPVPHFCREWDGDKGCYGFNEDHGMTWEEVRAEIVAWYEKQAESWRVRTEAEEFPPMEWTTNRNPTPQGRAPNDRRGNDPRSSFGPDTEPPSILPDRGG